MTIVRRLPAEEGIWAFVFADMVVFAIFFNVFAYYHHLEPAVFHAGQNSLAIGLGLINTFILLASSWSMVLALRAVRARARRATIARLLVTLGCGGAFAALKIVEYSAKVAAGHYPVSDNFYMLYFMFTGIHLLHLIVGMVAVGCLAGFARTTDWSEAHVRYFEGGAVYWHMVDLLWVVLFPLIYLVR